MAYRIAVASSDGKFINKHFGQAQQFLIFEIGEKSEGESRFLELRENVPPCRARQHDEDLLAAAVELLADCQAVLAVKIGPGAAAALSAKGIAALEVTAYIDEALEKLKNRMHVVLPGRNLQ